MLAWIVAILVFVSISLWKVASNKKGDLPNRMAGYTYAVYFMILAGVTFWKDGNFLGMCKPLLIGGACLVAIGFLGSRYGNEPHVEPPLRAFEKIFASNLVFLGIALILTSGLIRLVLFLRTTVGGK